MARIFKRVATSALTVLGFFVVHETGAPASAAAQEVQLQDQLEGGSLTAEPQRADDTQHARGVYTGVKPGGEEKPAVPAVPNTTPIVVTWPGFQMRPDGVSRVFVQTTAPVTTQSSQQGNTLVVDLGESQVGGETNQFALYTRFFNTPVVRAQLKAKAKHVLLELELRAAVMPTITSEQAKSGFFFVYLDFPAGDYVSKDQQPMAMPAGKKPEAVTSRPQHLDEGYAPLPEPTKGKAKASGKASASADTSMDAELPPGMSSPKKAEAKTETKASGGVSIGK